MYMYIRPYRGKLHHDEKPVLNDQSVTPVQMQNLSAQGKSIAASSLEEFAYFDGIPADQAVPLEYRRGVDLYQVWSASKAAKEKLKGWKRTKAQQILEAQSLMEN